MYSENFNSILFPLNSKAPDSGKLEINSGGVSSSGPPLGGEIAAHEKKIIIRKVNYGDKYNSISLKKITEDIISSC